MFCKLQFFLVYHFLLFYNDYCPSFLHRQSQPLPGELTPAVRHPDLLRQPEAASPRVQLQGERGPRPFKRQAPRGLSPRRLAELGATWLFWQQRGRSGSRRLSRNSPGVSGKRRGVTDVREEVPGGPHLLYLLPGFLPHEQGEGDGRGVAMIARGRSGSPNRTWKRCSLQLFV